MNPLLQAVSVDPTSARSWGELADGRKAHRWTLRNAQDMRVEISDLGASLLAWHAPDRHGRLDNVLLEFASPAPYAEARTYPGSVIGRCANRIAHGVFELDGKTWQLERNNNGHQLHGGRAGFHQALWQVEPDAGGLLLRLHSPDGDSGYPGNLDVELRYVLHDDGALTLEYRAHSDQATPINLTAHPYFNLGGARGDIRDHLLRIDAEQYLEVDAGLIPIALESVAGTAFDFRHPAPLGSRLNWPDAQLQLAGGFDHCFCLGESKQVRTVAEVRYPLSGRRLTVRTDQPGLQLYTGQHLADPSMDDGSSPQAFAGFCLEAQAIPNQINTPQAERTVLRPGAEYRQYTSYQLDIG